MSRWRHKKRGTCYTVLGTGTVQCAKVLRDDQPVVVYQGDDGALWVRPIEEFYDGRFEAVEVFESNSKGTEKP